jgi:hypothetical protein
MPPPEIKAIVGQIEKIIGRVDRSADEREKRNTEQQKEIATAVQSLTDELQAQQAKEEAAEPAKRCRENVTIVALWLAALFTLALAALSAYQLVEMRKAYEPQRQSAEAASKQATAGRAYSSSNPKLWCQI